MHFQQALRLEPRHFTLSMQSSTVRRFKSEAGWIDLWGCLLSFIDYRKSFVRHRSSLVHPWCSGRGGRSGFRLQRAFGDVQTWGLTGQAGPQHTTTLHCDRAGWLSSCWHGQWWPTRYQMTAGFHLWERQVLLPTFSSYHWIPRAAGAKTCTLHRSERAVARQQFLTARNGRRQISSSQPASSHGIEFSRVSSQFSQWSCGC